MGELLDNFLKVYQLANFIKHSRLQEERLRQQMEDDRIERARRNQEQDFGIRMRMEDLGATQVKPIGDIQPGFGSDWLAAGKKRQVTVPGGETYQVPTFEERQSRLLESIKAKAGVETGIAATKAFEQERARQLAKFKFGPKEKTLIVPPDIAETLGIPEGVTEMSKDQLKVFEDQYNRTHQKAGGEVNDQIVLGEGPNGEVTAVAINPRTHRKTPLGGLGIKREKSAAAAKAPKELSAGAKKAWEDFEKEKEAVAAMPAGPEKDAALKEAIKLRDRTVLVHGDELEPGPSEGGWPDIRPKKQGQETLTQSQSGRTGRAYPASAIAADAQAAGLSVSAFRKELARRGIPIDEQR